MVVCFFFFSHRECGSDSASSGRKVDVTIRWLIVVCMMMMMMMMMQSETPQEKAKKEGKNKEKKTTKLVSAFAAAAAASSSGVGLFFSLQPINNWKPPLTMRINPPKNCSKCEGPQDAASVPMKM